ncbi:MAG: hypothetical protein IT547_02660, partial [Hyphomonadaceae bacterium]|nr:hypothetical protein [Hyphomonadaceae bacterium]
MKNKRNCLFSTAALAIVATMSPAAAQDQTAAPEDDFGVSEIVVTAQRREQNLQDVPVAV